MTRLCVAIAAWLLVTPMGAEAQSPYKFTDYFNRKWTNEWVTFPASPEDIASAKAGHALVDSKGTPTLYQLTATSDGTPRLGLLANIDPFSTQRYRFDPASRVPVPASDIQIEQVDESTIRFHNSLTGILLTTRLDGSAGPVQGIKLNSGEWVGGSKLPGAPPLLSSTIRILEQGPAMARVEVVLRFEGDKTWRIEARMQAHEPVVHLTESFDLGEKSRWLLNLNHNFEPDTLIGRQGMDPKSGANPNSVGTVRTWPVAAKDEEVLFFWEPWLHWWQRPRQGTWFGLFNSHKEDLLALAACEAGRWVDPKQNSAQQGWNRAVVAVTQTDRGPQATFSLDQGERVWIIAALDKAASLKPLADGPKAKTAPLPQQYQIKHGEFPLELINSYTLTWKDTGLEYPRLYLTPSQLSALREQGKTMDFSKNSVLGSMHKHGNMIRPHEIPEAVDLFIHTGNKRVGEALAQMALTTVQEAVDIFLKQEKQFTFGFAPHHRRAITAGMGLADLVLGTDCLSAEEKVRIKAQVALLGYTTVRDDYWSPPRGFSANPNMTSTVMSFQVTAGSLIPDHPKAREWVDRGLAECNRQLMHWTDEEGGSLEAPHYSMVTYNYLMGCYVMAYNAGFSERLFDDRMKKVGQMYAHISTPPDPRAKGMRHLPPVGNTYFTEPSGQFGTLAYLWQEKDPDYAAQMRWMFEQHGRWPDPGVGAAYTPLSTVRRIYHSAPLPAKTPSWGSKLFPEQGVVLHSHFPSDRETQLYLISGSLHAHYDKDSGSITFWGKGSPFVDDFGYNGRAPASQHSMFIASTSNGGSVMATKAFEGADLMDYTEGQRQAATRQLMLVKDDDPLGMNYLVMRDSLEPKAAAEADWRIWLDVVSVKPDKNAALAKGHWDVDLDVCMLTPEKPHFRTQNVSVGVWGVLPSGTYGKNTPARIGLIATIPKGSDAAAVLFPRLKDEKPPAIESLHAGRVVAVTFNDTTDYVFLSQDRFEHTIDGIAFSGTVGIARRREGKVQLALGAAGTITHGDQSVEREKATPRRPLATP